MSNGFDIEYYGSYRNMKFSDFYPTYDDFADDYVITGFNVNPEDEISQENLTLMYKLLFARYGNSTIATSDAEMFKFKLFSVIFQYAPTWIKELDIQRKVRNLSDKDLETGNTHIINHAYNPSTDPSTATLDELTYINEQNTSKTKRGKLDQYDYVLQLLKKDVTEAFLDRFKKLFLTVVAPEIPLWYEED